MSTPPKKLCIISSDADSKQVAELVKRLRPFEERQVLDIWFLADVPPGSVIQEHLTVFLLQADCVLIWISPDLWSKGELYSLFVKSTDLQPLHANIVPLLARHAIWESDDFLKSNESNLIPVNRRPMPTDSIERRDEWLTTTANVIAIKMGILPQKRLKPYVFWTNCRFWAWFIPVLIGIVALYFAYPFFIADSHKNNKRAKQETTLQPPVPECGFPVNFDSTQLFVLITRFEDNLNKENETGCYGRGIARRIDEIKNRDNLPIKICYQDSLSPTLSDDAARLRDFYHADIIVWGNLQNESNCQSDGFCLKFQPSDTLLRYAGGQITPKVDNEYQPNISALDLEAGLINMGRESFDAWLLGISNLKIGRKKPEFYRISPDQPVEKQAEEYGKRANMFFQLGILEKTIQDYNEAINLKPSFILYYRRGIAYAKTGQEKNAISDFNKAISYNSNDANVYYNRGKCYAFLNRIQEYKADFNKAIQIDPNYESVYNFLSVQEYKSGQFEKSINYLNRCIKINPKKVDYYIARSGAYRKLGLNDAAISDLNEVLRLDSHFYKAYDNLGAIKFELGQYQAVISDLDKYIQHDTTNVGVYYIRGNSKNYLGLYKEAISDFNKAIQLDSNTQGSYEGRSKSNYYLGQYQASIDDLDHFLKLDSSNASVFFNRGISKSMLDMHKEAILDFDRANHIDPKDVNTYVYRGISENSLGQYELAIRDFNKSIQLQPQNVDSYVHRGTSRNGLGQYESAIQDFNKAVQLQSNIFIYLDRGIAKRNLGRLKESIADFNIAILNKPENADYYHNRGIAYWEKGEYFSACSDFLSAFRFQYLPGWRLHLTIILLVGFPAFWRFRKRKMIIAQAQPQPKKSSVKDPKSKSKKIKKR